MILADKIMKERKKCGWSQEELAEKLNVSRQSVSKWEGAQSVPDLQKIMKMSELFGVSTDYLLKDEIETSTPGTVSDEETPVTKVSMEEANEYLKVTKENAFRIAIATFLCILSPISLLLLGGASEAGYLSITETVACGIGIVILLLFIVVAVAIFVLSGLAAEKFNYLTKEEFETEYGVPGMVKERKKQQEKNHAISLVGSISACILGVVPVFLVALDESDMFAAGMVALTLALEAFGVFFLIRTAVSWSGFEVLLQEGDYTKKKKKDTVSEILSTVYWLLAVAIYLGWSFLSEDWKITWVVWPIVGVLYPAFLGIVKLFRKAD